MTQAGRWIYSAVTVAACGGILVGGCLSSDAPPDEPNPGPLLYDSTAPPFDVPGMDATAAKDAADAMLPEAAESDAELVDGPEGTDTSSQPVDAAPDGAGVDGQVGSEADGAPEDAGIDSGTDAGIESGKDAGIDSGTDAGIDSGTDAGIDSGTDVGTDSGTDAGIDSGTDAGIDSAVGLPVLDASAVTDEGGPVGP